MSVLILCNVVSLCVNAWLYWVRGWWVSGVVAACNGVALIMIVPLS